MRNKFSLIILTLLCLAGCNKDEPINNNDLYNDQLFSLSVAKKHLDSLLTINDIQLQVNWDQATLATDSTFSFVEVPYTAKEVKYNLYRLNNEDVNNDLSRAKYSRSTLLIYLSNEGELKTNIITYIPDTSYINDNDRILDQNRFASLDRKFSGYIEYKDILGTPTRLLMIKQGEVKRSFSLSPGNGTLQPNKKMSNGAANGTKITADMQQMTTSNCTPVCMPVFAEVCAGPACPGPMPEDCQCSVQQVGQNCEMICEGGGTGTPNPGTPPTDINNKTIDPCLKTTVDELLQVKNIEGTMADILSALEANTKVDISVTQGQTAHGVIAETRSPSLSQNRDPDHVVYESIFRVEIRIDESLFQSAAKEGIAASLIHEVLHAYMNYKHIDYNQQFAQHTIISEKYIQALSSFLISKYSLPPVDANALAWHGVEETKLFTDTESFNIDGEEVSPRDLQATAAQYYGGVDDKPGRGRPLCSQ